MRSVQWIDDSVYKHLQDHILFENFEPGTILCGINEKSPGIYIIVSGLIKITGTSETVKSGILPNTDSYLYFFEKGEFYDFLGVAQCLGLLGILLQTPLCTSAICETKVETIFIPLEKMIEVMQTFNKIPSLLYRIWKFVSFDIAVYILKQQRAYLECNEESIRTLTKKSIIPNLENITEYERPKEVTDIILIQGYIKNAQNGEMYYGPCYIPCLVKQLIFMPIKTRQARLIVLFYLTDYFILPKEITWEEENERRYKKLMTFKHLEIPKIEQNSSADIKNIEKEYQLKEGKGYHNTFADAFIRSPLQTKEVPVTVSKLLKAAREKANERKDNTTDE
ncbi:sperm-specific sodium:proton exchanger-like [Centruroides vittatus]|uniref:sperm-specific sodium:proton exchanger-like n=1 Tax=Centruroides vittatus TaxID=120091 RepID=UPI00350ED645